MAHPKFQWANWEGFATWSLKFWNPMFKFIFNKIREQLDNGNVVFAIFVDLQKYWNSRASHNYPKLNHYGIRQVDRNWFSSYFQSRLLHVSINGLNFNFEYICCGASHSSINRSLSSSFCWWNKVFNLTKNQLKRIMKTI